MDELMKTLYDAFYEPASERQLEKTAEGCHRQLIERLEKPERKLVLRIIDTKDQIAEELSIDGFIAGFQLAWRLAQELQLREKERPTPAKRPCPGALSMSKEKEEQNG